MTIFTLPRAFRGEFSLIQRNAIMSWRLCCPRSEIILFGDEEGTKQLSESLKLRHVAKMKINKYGTPYINEIFFVAQEIARDTILCYVNADIILLDDLDSLVQRIRARFEQFLLVQRRWDLWEEWRGTNPKSKGLSLGEVDFTKDWRSLMRQKIRQYGRLHHPGAVDCFIFTKGLYPRGGFPSYLLGRQLWDSWLLHDALNRNIPTIDVGSELTVIHQDHTRTETYLNPKRLAIEKNANRALCAVKSKITDSEYVLLRGHIRKRSY